MGEEGAPKLSLADGKFRRVHAQTSTVMMAIAGLNLQARLITMSPSVDGGGIGRSTGCEGKGRRREATRPRHGRLFLSMEK